MENEQLSNPHYVVTSTPENLVEKGIDRIAEVVENLGGQYIDHLKEKAVHTKEIEKENIKSQRQLNWMSAGLLSLVIVIAATVVIFNKDVPPALNSILCFVAGYSAKGLGGFISPKGEEKRDPKMNNPIQYKTTLTEWF